MRKVLYILGQLADEDVDWLIANGERRCVPSGATLIREGIPVEDVYIVLEGALSVRVGPSLREIARLGTGDIVGELSFLDKNPPSATVVAPVEAVVFAVPRTRLAAKIREDLQFAARFYRALGLFLAQRLRTSVSQFGCGDPTAKEERTTDDTDDLEDLSLAGSRFDFLTRRLSGRG